LNKDYDIVLKNGIVFDGSGSTGQYLDIGIKGNTIMFSGKIDNTTNAKKVIDAQGCIISPGFIDIHSHSDFLWLLEPESYSKVHDGVTTEICGNCGSSPFPVKGLLLEHRQKGFSKYGLDINWKSTHEYFKLAETRQSAINRGFLVGHGNLRACNVGYEDRPANDNEMHQMKHELTDALDEGAFGMSSGIAYPPGCFAPAEEIIELCKIVKAFDGVYTSHIRDEGDTVEQSILEAINAAKESGVDLQISHIKTAGKNN